MPGITITNTMPEISIIAEQVFEILGFPISNSLIASWLTILILVAVSFLVTRDMKLAPAARSSQNFVETVLEMFYNGVAKIRAGDQVRLFFPLSATIFFFILISNWLGALIPGFGSIGLLEHHHGKEVFVPFLRSTCSDLNTTIALALFAVISTQVYGTKVQGFFRYAGRFIRVKGFVDCFKSLVGLRPRQGMLKALMNAVIDAFIGVLEVFDEFTKLLSFSFRLFGNIFAGEVLLIVIALLIPFVAPLPFQALELFVGYIQALIFATLTLVFLKMATAHHG